jgi:excisionase family DNA binding protein
MSFLAALSSEAVEELRGFVQAEVAAALATRDREPAKRWLSAREAGMYLGCSERAVHQRIRRGRIPTEALRHQGRRLLLDRVALDRALEAER